MKEIKSKEGYYLTQVDEVSDNRIFVTALKGVNVNESQWREATQYEKDEWKKAHTPESKKRVR